MGLPIVGYLPWLTDAPHLDFIRLSKKYGNVFKIHLMGRDFYILNNYDVIKEAFVTQKDNFLRRPTEFSFFFWALGPNAMGAMNGDTWKLHRKFSLKALTTLGFGQSWIRSSTPWSNQHFAHSHGKDEWSALWLCRYCNELQLQYGWTLNYKQNLWHARCWLRKHIACCSWYILHNTRLWSFFVWPLA